MSHRNNKRKRTNKRKRAKKLLLAFFIMVAVGLLCGLSLTVFFPVKHIQVSGSSFYNADQIAFASGLDTQDNLLAISEDKILQNIQSSLAFVDSIELKIKFPDTVIIKVTDSQEFCCCKINDKYYSVDKKGRVLKEYTEQPTNLMIIEGNAVLSGTQVRVISFENTQAQELIDLIVNESENFPLKADYIDITDTYGIKMGFDSRFTVEFGESVYMKEKLALLYKMMETKSQDESGTFKLDMWSPENPKGSYFKNDI